MGLLLTYAVTLFFSVLVSDLVQRSVLSTAVLFLAAGGLVSTLGWVEVAHDNRTIWLLADLALVSILFSDGTKACWHELREAWRLPGRALLIGLPLTLALTAVIARIGMGWSWHACFLVGAVLSPTDPVFASAIVGEKTVPNAIRHLLNVESGLNDGLALPLVLILLAASDLFDRPHRSRQ
jgi:NhaP-type Na+/H+ or K+/H+ antiporter